MNKRTCLYDRHVALGALVQPFGGFDMPIQYSSIIEEHNAVRQHCGVFDVSHMGETFISGEDAERFVNHIFTNDVTGAPIGQIFYGMMCYPDGGTVDDLLVYKMGEQLYFLVINAANIDKDMEWIMTSAEGFNVNIDHCSERYGQLAVQGPEAETVMEEVLQIPCKDLVFYTAKTLNVDGVEVIVSRTGYTGEDGFEIYGSHEYIVNQWDKLMESGRCKPCGLGCRDTLRFEVGLPLYGDELSQDISPVMAGFSMFCKFDKPEFIGKEALLKQKTEGVARRLRGLMLDDRAVPRHGYKVLKDGVEVGEVTTGYRLISVDQSCAVALVDSSLKLGDRVEVQIRKKTFPATIVKKKFYDKHYKK
ncbi:MAG: glycine cleavage system aminomethyltransferase GcvT [Prevotella sp.]|uniref:Aminomethyltransferase n=1 Tax=Hallella faecis TaxID=2841596 RepID=A0ABV1FSE6_9BACT|nr:MULTISPECIES: glycine cleavage system aminomethyltransferase GcvT [Hallella]MBU0290566.1 glycine cleavage system aminomethyltransferase GcvT [Hallella faecis]MCI7433298.1 glycine cleavage system aminomethyltransferase GcvT [Prevotella sp.]MDD7144865.1 glycine cleavage system aminomethyltransferase GcvT [Hallella sp.]MDY5926058.1 glycine cleavage system aminomethyltransferase GcvT [Hallella sp.]